MAVTKYGFRDTGLINFKNKTKHPAGKIYGVFFILGISDFLITTSSFFWGNAANFEAHISKVKMINLNCRQQFVKKQNKGTKRKLFCIILISFAILTPSYTYCYYIKKTALNKNSNLEAKRETNDLKPQFSAFFKDLREAAVKKDFAFVKKTFSHDQLEVIKQLRKMDEEMVISGQAKDLAAIKDDMITGYSCVNNCCSVTIMRYNDPKNTSILKYVYINNSWLVKDDDLPSLEQLKVINKLSNDYQISFYSKGNAIFKVYLNGSALESITESNPTGSSSNKALFVNNGNNKLTIEITSLTAVEQQITYAYDLFQIPKGSGSNAIFNDEYKLATSGEAGSIVNFVNIKLDKTKKIEIPFVAK